MKDDDGYLPVPWDFRDMIEEARKKHKSSFIHFFTGEDKVDSVEGEVAEVLEVRGEGEFLVLNNGARVRLDRIITLYGLPGPAYDRYEALGNVCLECTGGYEL